MAYEIGQIVMDDWKIIRELGEGSFGKVFEIQKIGGIIEVPSALKVITIPKSASEVNSILNEGLDEASTKIFFQDMVNEVTREISNMALVKNHPNVVRYEDHKIIEHTNEIGWDVLTRMELLMPLDTYMRQHKMAESDVITLGEQICDALIYCHGKGMIHRDIKPANLFVNELGYFKLGDFGIARTVEKTTGEMSQKGTLNYMAPEIYMNRPYGVSVDIYSLGMVMYRMLNDGRAPFMPLPPAIPSSADRDAAMIARMRGDRLPAPSKASPALAAVLVKACSADVNERYKSAAEFKQALTIARQNTGIVGVQDADATVAAVSQSVYTAENTEYARMNASLNQTVQAQPQNVNIAVTPAKQEPQNVKAAAASANQNSVGERTTKKGPKPAVFIAIGAVLLCAIIGAAVGIILKNRNDNQHTTVISASEKDKKKTEKDTDKNDGKPDAGNMVATGEPQTIRMMRVCFNCVPDSARTQEVEDAINAYLKGLGKDYVIDLEDVDSGEYTEKAKLAIAGEEVDLLWTASWESTIGCHDLINLNSVKDITGLIQGTQLYNSMDANTWAATQHDGRNYFIPVYKDNVEGYNIMIRQDLIDKYGINVSSIKNLQSLTPVLEMLSSEGLNYTYLTQRTALFYRYYIDRFDFFTNDATSNFVAVDRKTNEVIDTILTPEYIEFCTLMAQWHEAGYISDDDIDKSTADSICQSKDWAVSWWFDVPNNDEADGRYGQDVTMVKLTKNWYRTDSALGSCYAITESCSDEVARAAIDFMGVLYTDSKLADIYTYGIEGKDFYYSDGLVVKDWGATYNHSMWESASALAVTASIEAPYTPQMYKDFNNAEISRANGFHFDKAPVEAKYVACQNIFEQYGFVLENGGVASSDVKAKIQEYQSALNAAGYQDVLAEFKKQYDAWKK